MAPHNLFRFAVIIVAGLFTVTMVYVAAASFYRSSSSTGVDPATIQKIRFTNR